MEAARPNNDLRPWDRSQGEYNDPWTYEPTEGRLQVIKDCGEHTAWIPKSEVGVTLPVCHPCHNRALDDDLGADQDIEWWETP